MNKFRDLYCTTNDRKNTEEYDFSLKLCACVRYLEGALVPDSKDTVPPEVPTGRRRDYVPRADPGLRLPHMNVRVLSNIPSEVYNPVMHLSFMFFLVIFSLYFYACEHRVAHCHLILITGSWVWSHVKTQNLCFLIH